MTKDFPHLLKNSNVCKRELKANSQEDKCKDIDRHIIVKMLKVKAENIFKGAR